MCPSYHNKSISQIPECTCSKCHNTPFITEMCIIMFWMEQFGIRNSCILGFVIFVYHLAKTPLVSKPPAQVHGVRPTSRGSQATWGGVQSLTCKYVCRCAKRIGYSWITSGYWVMGMSHQLALCIANNCKFNIVSWRSISVQVVSQQHTKTQLLRNFNQNMVVADILIFMPEHIDGNIEINFVERKLPISKYN